VFCPNRTPEQAAHARPGKVDLYEKYIQTLRRSAELLALLLVLAVSAGAASSQNVGVKFWKERSDKESMANSGIDPDRTATLTRQANGTYTLTLPVMQVSKLGVTGYLSGLTIGDVTYDGTLTGDFNKATAVLTIKNLPASVRTGRDGHGSRGAQDGSVRANKKAGPAGSAFLLAIYFWFQIHIRALVLISPRTCRSI